MFSAVLLVAVALVAGGMAWSFGQRRSSLLIVALGLLAVVVDFRVGHVGDFPLEASVLVLFGYSVLAAGLVVRVSGRELHWRRAAVGALVGVIPGVLVFVVFSGLAALDVIGQEWGDVGGFSVPLGLLGLVVGGFIGGLTGPGVAGQETEDELTTSRQ